MPRAADVLIDELSSFGIDTAFGVPGESYLDVLDAIASRGPCFRFITCRQEGGASMAAEAWGKLTGRPGLCMVTRGPGAANALAGIHVAQQDSTPLIVLVGQVEQGFRHRDAFQEIDYEALFRPVAKWVAEIRQPHRIAEYASRAVHCAMTGRPGPVVLSLPEDMLAQECPVSRAAPPLESALSAPTPEAVQRFVELLTAARRPLVIAGGAGWTAQASRVLEEFCEKWNLPVAADWRRQDVVDNEYPRYVGQVGLRLDPVLQDAIGRCDLLIALGARLSEATTSGYGLFDIPVPRQPLVHVHPDPDEIGQVYRPTLGIAAGALVTMRALPMTPPAVAREERWVTGLRNAYETFTAPVSDQSTLELATVFRHISDNLPAGGVVCNGAGAYSIWLQRFFRYRGFGSQVSPTSGTMGYGLPAAIAAAFLAPGADIVCLAGDGCFMITCQELATAVHYGLNIKVLVFDNRRYGTIRLHQERRFPGRVVGSELTNPDFAAFARSFGIPAIKVERTEEFSFAFRQAIDQKGPCLIEVVMDRAVIAPGIRVADQM